MTSTPVLFFGYAAYVREVVIGFDNLEGTSPTRPDAPPKPSFMHTEQRSAWCAVQSEAFALMQLLIAALQGRIDVRAPPLGIDAKLYHIRFFS